jgi:hypothetical protein
MHRFDSVRSYQKDKPMKRRRTYVSIDMEADGPYPGPHSMLSIGAVAIVGSDRKDWPTFKVNLRPLEGATRHPNTMRWWSDYPEAWEAATTNPIDPREAMQQFREWVMELPVGVKNACIWPCWDFMWVHWYFEHFLGNDPFGFAYLDMKSYAAGKLDISFGKTQKFIFPKAWFEDSGKHSHDALEDAMEQALMLKNLLAHKEL